MTTIIEDDGLATLGIPHLRVELIAELRRRDRASLPELARALGHTRNGLAPHLESLVKAGLVTVTSDRIPTCCRPVRFYRMVPERAEELAWRIFDLLTDS